MTDAEERFRLVLARRAYEKLNREGHIFLMLPELEEDAIAAQASETQVRHVLRQLEDAGLLESKNGHLFQGYVGLALLYEEQYDRRAFWHSNTLRKEILQLAADAFERDVYEIDYHEEGESFTDRPYGEALAASHTLEYMGLVQVGLTGGRHFGVRITPTGYDVVRDETRLRRELPASATEDEEAHAAVARDTMASLISSVEALLRARSWTGALRELGRGDGQFDEGHWADAVGEYYSALESGLKHRLDEEGVRYGEKASLRELAREASKAGVIPRNYQEIFGFADSIRSPRRHGSGGRTEEVEVGPAEALLMGNHVRALLLYLGHRP